jgi:hypothetical protein
LEENLLKNLEGNKIKIFVTLMNNPNWRYIKVYVTKVWNLCRMLNYTRNIKDTDNNYFLLRLKDIMCDLFFLVFTNMSNEISLQDVFNLIQITTEVGTIWMKVDINNSVDSWIAKIDNIMKFLILKINEIEILISLDKKFYINFIDYLNFYIEHFLMSEKMKNNNNVSDTSDFIYAELIKIINLLKNIKFNENDSSTKNLLINLVSVCKNFSNQHLLTICESIDSLKFKFNLPFEIISELYKIYIQILIENNSAQKAEEIIKIFFDIIPLNSKEEIHFCLLNLEVCAIFYENFDSNDHLNKIIDITEVLFEHKELCFESFEALIVKLSDYKCMTTIFYDNFSKKVKNLKSLKLQSNKIVFNFENVRPHVNLCFIYLYCFIVYILDKTKINDINDLQLNGILSTNFLEIIKVFSEGLLENFSNDLYDEEYSTIIPFILKNIIILFFKLEKGNDGFSNYFIMDVVKKVKKSCWKEFADMSLELYIEKKDYIKLKSLIRELEENKTSTGSLLIYSQLVLIINEGNKWNSHNIINNLCVQLNLCEDFHILYYIKLFNILTNHNSADLSLLVIILQNFVLKFIDIFKAGDVDKIKYFDNTNNQIVSLFDIIFEILLNCSKIKNFNNQIILFTDVFELIGNFVEFKKIDDNLRLHIIKNLSLLLDIINLVFQINSKKPLQLIDSKSVNEYPEFILIFSCKIFNFILTNFSIFCEEFFTFEMNSDLSLKKVQITNLLKIFEMVKSITVFYFSYEFFSINSNGEDEITKVMNLKSTYHNFELYDSNFSNSILLFKNKFSDDLESISLIDLKINEIILNIKSIEQILKIQFLSKIESEKWFEEFLTYFLNENIENKKLLFVTNSMLFHNGLKHISTKFIKAILNHVISSQELFIKVYSFEDVLLLFKDYVNLLDENDLFLKLSSIKEVSNFICKLFGKIDEGVLMENLEWVTYKIFIILENTNFTKLNKNEKEYLLVKSIFDDINGLNIKNRSFILVNLIDIILKKLVI